jgi:Tfp pilus assembly protein PilN
MRPVNLIPLEDRRGDQAPLRTGPLAYILLGALVLALLGVVAMVLTDNRISERRSDLTRVESEDAAAIAKASRLVAYTAFRDLSQQRVATVQSLADSRFDWERVLRELALVIPGDVSVVDLSASSGGGAEGEEGAESGGASLGGVAGPSLSLSGCAAGHAGVAGFITALKDIDGVTRVGVQSSTMGEEEGGGSGGEGGECSAGPRTADFSLVVAFDAAPAPAIGGEAEVAPTSTEGEAASDGSEEGAEG